MNDIYESTFNSNLATLFTHLQISATTPQPRKKTSILESAVMQQRG